MVRDAIMKANFRSILSAILRAPIIILSKNATAKMPMWRCGRSRDGGRPAGRELCGRAGKLSWHPRTRKNSCVAVRATMASLFTDRAISYRADRGFDHLKIALSRRRAEDGAFGQGVLRRDVHGRHGIRFPECRSHQRLRGAWAK